MDDVLERPALIGADDALDWNDPRLSRVAAKALAGIFKAWRLTNSQAVALVRESDRSWSRIKADFDAARLDVDQLQRASALIGLYKGLHGYFGPELADKWVRMPNRGPLFEGRSPLDYMVAGGIVAIFATRDYVDALRGGM